MNWDEQLVEACTETDGTPHPHTDHVLTGAKWQRDQLCTDEAVARLANFLHDDERQETLEEHEAWCKAPECEARQSYNKHARAAIDALIGQEP